MASFVPVSKTKWINMDLVVQATDRSPLGVDIDVVSLCNDDGKREKSIILLAEEAEALLAWLTENTESQ